jgi:hypothetical protein
MMAPVLMEPSFDSITTTKEIQRIDLKPLKKHQTSLKALFLE